MGNINKYPSAASALHHHGLELPTFGLFFSCFRFIRARETVHFDLFGVQEDLLLSE
jgi:hypothetical protein